MPRQPNRRPSIYLGSDGLYHCWVTLGTKPNGKPDRKHRKGRTATEVAAKVDELLERAKRGHGVPQKIETVEQWLTHWLEHVIKPRRAYGTYTAYRALINNYAIPHIGAWKLDGNNRRLEPEHLDAMYTAMAATKVVRGSRGKDRAPLMAAATIHKTHRMLSVAFKAAVRRGKAARNVCDLIDPPSYRAKKVAALTLAETEAVIREALQDEMAARWLLGLLMGPRQGETLGIRWPRVHLDPPAGEEPCVELETQLQRRAWQHGCDDPVACTEGKHRTEACRPPWEHGCKSPAACRPRPHLCPSRCPGKGCARHTRPCPPLCPPGCTGHARRCPRRVGGGIVEVDLKTEKSVRPLALPAVLVELLRRHRERQQQQFRTLGLEWAAEGLVFTSPWGRRLDAGQDHQAWEALLCRAGVADAKLHAARHTAGTMLIASGADISVVQEVLGHTQISTSRIYVDVAKKTQREAVDRAVSALMDGNLAALLQPKGATQTPPG
ncbi:tyrosine-type recombinase/integrase [Micromonospora sp. HUAS LYJ1]|uniref:tyrosine-type recombinase/integrase n=1 Tax=Micromonospora sp. HUAS LYJ1 TaxID=3061626 RepID=UPI0026719FC8|nr:tyrosine-type recombinase/integrase [Micromonospora sp. HUAS LYJ1]WKU03717.1 tyrosine-type recombinase/integrase [Micromonospora sp. HUAS LYJ1]